MHPAHEQSRVWIDANATRTREAKRSAIFLDQLDVVTSRGQRLYNVRCYPVVHFGGRIFGNARAVR